MAAKDYYKTLEVTRTADEKTIKAAYRRLARQYHPDVNTSDKNAEERFKEIGEAYEVLGDAEKRRKYDKWGLEWEKYDRAGATSHSSWGTGSGYKTQDSGFGDIFDQFFGPKSTGRSGKSGRDAYGSEPNYYQNRSSAPRPQRGEDREQEIDLTLEEAFNGALRELQIQSNESCPLCNGTGLKGGQRCSNCAGMGIIARSKRLEVRIPAGVDQNSKVRIAGEGGAGLSGGPRGDLILKIHLLSHKTFDRTGSDLQTTISVPLYTAILGGEVEVPSPKGGKFILNIPFETPNNKVFRLSGQGMPLVNQPGNRGDFYVKVNVTLPNNLSKEELELFYKLSDFRTQ